MAVQKFTVNEPALRLDVWLVEQAPQLSRRRARQLCESGKVFINGHVARAGAALRQGSVVEVHASLEAVRARELPVEGGLEHPVVDLAFEDESVLVIRKPRGVPSVTQREDDPPTVADFLVSFDVRQRDVSPDAREAGLLQRLDYWTSGFMLAARSTAVWEKLRNELFSGAIEKWYLAIVEGDIQGDTFVVEKPLQNSKDGKVMEIADPEDPKALSARSEISVIASPLSGMSLVRVNASRARRHQVRVHLASIGHPLLGDEQYGATRKLSCLSAEVLETIPAPHDGFLLHAERLSFVHPLTTRAVELSEGPVWLDAVLRKG